MKRFALALGVCAMGICAPAQAKVHTVAPPGNSGVNQYIEVVPTDHGNRPTSSVHSSGGGGGGGVNGGGGGGVNGGGGAGGGTTGGGSSAPVPQSTQRALSSQGADGKSAAALAGATAPRLPRGHGALGASSGSVPQPPRANGSPPNGSSALGSLADALTGSGSDGGLGPLLPVILLVALLGSAVMAILRRRRQT